MRPECCGWKSNWSLADHLKTSELVNIGYENQQYAQTECTSPTLHVPRHFPSDKRIHTSTCSHTECTVTVPVWLSVCLSRIRTPQKKKKNGAQAMCSVVNYGCNTQETCWKGQEARRRRVFTANEWLMVQLYSDKHFTIMVSTSAGDIPCPAGCKTRTLHKYSHKSFTLSLACAVSAFSCAHFPTCNHTLHTDA